MASPAHHLPGRVAGVLEIPLHRFLGVRLLGEERAAAGITFAAEEPALNNVGVLHGGVVTALLDVACYLALLPELGPATPHTSTHPNPCHRRDRTTGPPGRRRPRPRALPAPADGPSPTSPSTTHPTRRPPWLLTGPAAS